MSAAVHRHFADGGSISIMSSGLHFMEQINTDTREFHLISPCKHTDVPEFVISNLKELFNKCQIEGQWCLKSTSLNSWSNDRHVQGSLKGKKLEIKAVIFSRSSNKEPNYAACVRLCLSISADALSPRSLLIDVPLFLCFEMKRKNSSIDESSQ